MDQRRPPEYIIEVFADPTSVKEVIRGKLATDVNPAILHMIFFHRYFPSLRPSTRDVLEMSLPYMDNVEIQTLIDQRTAALVRQLDSSSDLGARNTGVRGLMAVQFFEKKRRKAWFTKGVCWIPASIPIIRVAFSPVENASSLTVLEKEEEVCWEQWTLDVTLATPRTESERAKVRSAMEAMLLKAAMKIVTTVNREKDHIPPITTSEANPFPYQIVINPKGDSWGTRMSIF
ncbi:DUF1649 domain protein [Rutstroemia sp. NJR-2017a WRK4]|nr:DUF1649 domain protein [Rutstroemia sp. NJR-2017a WRK4]